MIFLESINIQYIFPIEPLKMLFHDPKRLLDDLELMFEKELKVNEKS